MIKVALHEVKFFAYHGYYPEEQILGNYFTVDLEVDYNSKQAANDDLAQTVNYEMLYLILADEMKKPRKLLETLVQEMIAKIRSEFPFLETIKVGVKKMNPPLPGEVKCAYVEITDVKEA